MHFFFDNARLNDRIFSKDSTEDAVLRIFVRAERGWFMYSYVSIKVKWLNSWKYKTGKFWARQYRTKMWIVSLKS